MDKHENRKIIYIPVDKLHSHPDNPRKNIGDVTELAESIKVNGIMQNLTVVPMTGYYYGDYTVIIGHRRLAAAKLAGLEALPCVIVELSEKEQVSVMLTENIQRSDLTVYEQAQGFQLMIDMGDDVTTIAKRRDFHNLPFGEGLSCLNWMKNASRKQRADKLRSRIMKSSLRYKMKT